MGNLCQFVQNKPQVYLNNTTGVGDQNTDRINQIKQFLSLTPKNTQNCLDSLDQSSILKRQSKTIDNFKIVRGLGKGAFGQVYLVKDQEKNKCYAMKIIQKERIKCIKQKIYVFSQRYILESVDHPFIVKLHYAFQSKSKLYLLVDLMPGGQLFYLLRKQKKFPQHVAKFYAAQILLGIQYLHSKNIIYRDLKPENILLDKEGHVKLTDFGLSKVLGKNQLTHSICGTPEYIAPQVILGKGYSKIADWFSFGSFLYDMLTGAPPFYSKNKQQLLKNIVTKTVPLPEYLNLEAKSLLKNLFKIKPSERLGFNLGAKQIKQHKFFQQIDFDLLLKKKIQPPITFVQSQINKDGFDQSFEQIKDSIFEEKTYKGVGFDGFTYYIPDLHSFNKEELFESNDVINLNSNQKSAEVDTSKMQGN